MIARLTAAALLLAQPARADGLVLDCYVFQSGSGGSVQFVRHLQVDTERAVVSVADGLGGGRLRYIGTGRLVMLGPDRLVFDFASPPLGRAHRG